MNDEEFVEVVRRHAALSSSEEAESVARAALEALAERLDASQAKDLADQLPPGIAGYLQHEERGGSSGEAFALDEFVERVSELADARDPEQAASYAQAVMRAVEEAIAAGEEAEDERVQLPEELAPLLGAGESGLAGAGG